MLPRPIIPRVSRLLGAGRVPLPNALAGITQGVASMVAARFKNARLDCVPVSDVIFTRPCATIASETANSIKRRLSQEQDKARVLPNKLEFQDPGGLVEKRGARVTTAVSVCLTTLPVER